MSLLQNSNAIESGGYSINNSLRFQSASTQYLSRTPASAGNRKTWTWSAWVKRGTFPSDYLDLFCSDIGGADRNHFAFNSSQQIYISFNVSGTWYTTTTNAVFRDPSAWYHIVLTIDMTQATSTDRLKLYVNGVSQTFSAYSVPAQNTNLNINYNSQHVLGASYNAPPIQYYFDGYMAEVNFIDGQALTPSSFGETNTLTGQWVAKKYTGTYGTNGFYLPFSNGTSTTTLGADSSGNGNNWTLTNFTRSAGTSDCWMYDVPSGNGGASGTQPSSNYAVMNPLKRFNANMTILNGNMTANDTSSSNTTAVSSMPIPTSGKFYFECTMTSVASSSTGSGSNLVGVGTETQALSGIISTNGAYRSGNPIYNTAGVAQTAGSTYTNGDVIGVAIDADAGTVQFYKNNVAQGATPSFSYTPQILFPFVACDNVAGTKTYNLNFGQRSFAYTPPTGFKALCTANLPASTIVKGNQYMDATLYTGNGSTKTVTNAASFQPDLVWIKDRTAANHNVLFDSIRGAANPLFSNLTNAEQTPGLYGKLNSINSNGFTVASGTSGIDNVGLLNDNYVGWQWQAGQGTTSSNTSGSITSTVSVSTTAGFSVVTYTGNGTSGQVDSVGHGLGVTPKLRIVKQRNTTNDWYVFTTATGSNIYGLLNSTAALASSAQTANSSVFYLSGTSTNASGGTYVAYNFAEISGYSKFGSYTGNGSADGPFVYCGFRPKYVMIKCTNQISHWTIEDSSRSPYNVATQSLYADTSGSEITSVMSLDLLSNGFKCRNVLANESNVNGYTYIYMAFAENPFAQANAR